MPRSNQLPCSRERFATQDAYEACLNRRRAKPPDDFARRMNTGFAMLNDDEDTDGEADDE